MKSYSLVFAGTPDFACPALEALLEDPRFDVKLVVSQPDRPVGRKQEILPTPVKEIAQKHGIPVLQPEKIQDIQSELEAIKPDFFVVIAYGQILPQSILNIAKWNINLHGSILPKYRGASPIQSALLAGEKITGVSVMNIEQKMDAGAVYKTHEIQILPEDTAGSLFQKIADLGQLLSNDLDAIARGLSAQVQDESKATYCKKIQKEDGEIRWEEESAEEILNKLRAFTPWPGVFFFFKDKRIKVLSGKVLPSGEGDFSASHGFKTKAGYFLPIRILPEGRKEMGFEEWMRGT